jgi:hypothetical protein
MNHLMWLGFFFGALVNASPATAHVPYFASDARNSPVVIQTGLKKSVVFYARLLPNGEIDGYFVEVTPEDLLDSGTAVLHAGVLVPRCRELHQFAPELYLIGPAQRGLVTPDRDDERHLPLVVPEGHGYASAAMRVPKETRDETLYYERYSGTYYWRQPDIDIEISRPGVYRLFVLDQGRSGGDYVLEFGDTEILTARDWVRAAAATPFLRAHWEIADHGCRLEAGRRDLPMD